MAMGEDVALLRAFSRRTAGGVPAVAILLQLVVVTLMLLTQSFEAVLEYIQFSLTLCSFLAVLGRDRAALDAARLSSAPTGPGATR